MSEEEEKNEEEACRGPDDSQQPKRGRSPVNSLAARTADLHESDE